MSDDKLQPYRIEWRVSRTVRWVLVTTLASHDEALVGAQSHADRYGGQTRVIAQHVIATYAGAT